MLLPHLILAGLWILYCFLHSLMASQSFKQKVQSLAGSGYRYYRLFYTLFAAFSLAGVIYYQVTIDTLSVFQPALLTTVVGSLLGVTGLVIMFICIKKYFLSLSGLKSLYQEAPSAELMIRGIHRYLRHPLYLGTFLFIWGLWVVFPSLGLLVADVVITAYTLYAIQLEEDKLVLEFGEKYRQYQKEVPKLLPRFSLAEPFQRDGR